MLLSAEGGQDDGAFDDRLAALKAAKKQARHGSSRKDGKDKDGAPKQGEKRCSKHQLNLMSSSFFTRLYTSGNPCVQQACMMYSY